MIVHSYIQTQGGMGFGDFLRGSMALHQVCYGMRIPYAVTFKDHPIAQFIIDQNSILPDVEIHNLNNQCVYIPQLKDKLNEIKGNRKFNGIDLGVHCNVFPNFPIHWITKKFMTTLLSPNEILDAAIQEAKPNKDYEVIHIRVGDMLAYNTAINFTVDYDIDEVIGKAIAKIKEIKSKSDRLFIIMCDSDKIKKMIAKKCDLIPTSAKSVHFNIATSSDTDRVKDTLVDFFLLKDAKAVHQFSVHGWGSTFSNCANWIYDTQLNQYKLIN